MNHDAVDCAEVDSQGLALLMRDNPAIRMRVRQLERIATQLSHMPTPETYAKFDREAAVDELTSEYLRCLRRDLEKSKITQQLVFSGRTELRLHKENHHDESLHSLAVERTCSLLAGEGFYVYFAYFPGFSSYSSIHLWRCRPPWYVRMLKPLAGYLEAKPV